MRRVLRAVTAGAALIAGAAILLVTGVGTGALYKAGKSPVASIPDNPPPRPPNCPDLPERENLILADGSLADVRIVRIGAVNLYIPASWARPYFLVQDAASKVVIHSSTILDPELHDVECPGVVHILSFDQSSPAITLWAGSTRRPLPGLAPEGDVSMVRLVADLPDPSLSLRVVHGRLHHLPRLNPVPGLAVYLGIDAEIRTKNLQSPAIDDFVRWLALPPKRRDNARTFKWKTDPL